MGMVTRPPPARKSPIPTTATALMPKIPSKQPDPKSSSRSGNPAMTTAKQRSRRSATPQQQHEFDAMMALAEKAGCQLRAGVKGQYRGFCPFHFATHIRNIRTLRVNERQRTFQCSYCSISGRPVLFAAHYWQVATTEAAIMLQDPISEITAERPVPIALRQQARDLKDHRLRQNTYLLTKATLYYHQALNRDPATQLYLNRLGVPLRQRDNLLLGFAQGSGLYRHLTQKHGVSSEEIAQSPLFITDAQGHSVERYRGVLMIPSLDEAGNADWLLGVPPRSPDFDRPWSPIPAKTLPIGGYRPTLLGLYGNPRRAERLYLTDDIRVWLTLRGAGLPCLRLNSAGNKAPDYTLAALARSQPQSITVAVLRTELSRRLTREIRKTLPETDLSWLEPERIIHLLPPPQDPARIASALEPGSAVAEPDRATNGTGPHFKVDSEPTMPELLPEATEGDQHEIELLVQRLIAVHEESPADWAALRDTLPRQIRSRVETAAAELNPEK